MSALAYASFVGDACTAHYEHTAALLYGIDALAGAIKHCKLEHIENILLDKVTYYYIIIKIMCVIYVVVVANRCTNVSCLFNVVCH